MKKFLAAFAILLGLSGAASANVPCSLPYTLTNGTIADASQVMANYNALVTCLTNAAAAGANNDITSITGLTTPLSPGQGGSNVYLGVSPAVSGNTINITTTVPLGFATQQNYTVRFISPIQNTSANPTPQLNVNNQGAAYIYKQSTAGPIPLTGGELVTGQIVNAYFDGTYYEINPFPNTLAGFGLSVSQGTVSISSTTPPYGFDGCVNLSMKASVASNLLTITFLAADINGTPTSLHPILCPFRDSTIANGDPVWVAVVTGLSINTNATGATLGSVNSTPFKFWIELFNNAGTVVPALYNALITTPQTQIYALDESSPQSTTGIGSGSTSAGVFYTPNGTSLSSKSFRIAGYLEYTSGLTTAGTYASAPNKLQLFGPGIKKPGDVLQDTGIVGLYNQGSSTTSYTPSATPVTTAAGASCGSFAFTPADATNVVVVSALAGLWSSTGNAQLTSFLYNGSSVLTQNSMGGFTVAGTNATAPVGIPLWYSAIAGGTSSITFTLYGTSAANTKCNINGNTVQMAGINSWIRIQELVD